MVGHNFGLIKITKRKAIAISKYEFFNIDSLFLAHYLFVKLVQLLHFFCLFQPISTLLFKFSFSFGLYSMNSADLILRPIKINAILTRIIRDFPPESSLDDALDQK